MLFYCIFVLTESGLDKLQGCVFRISRSSNFKASDVYAYLFFSDPGLDITPGPGFSHREEEQKKRKQGMEEPKTKKAKHRL